MQESEKEKIFPFPCQFRGTPCLLWNCTWKKWNHSMFWIQ